MLETLRVAGNPLRGSIRPLDENYPVAKVNTWGI